MVYTAIENFTYNIKILLMLRRNFNIFQLFKILLYWFNVYVVETVWCSFDIIF